MLSRDTLDQIPDVIANRIAGANEYMFQKLGDHINRLGKVMPSDMNRIRELYRAGVEISEIEKELAKRTERATAEIKALIDEYTADNLARAYDAYQYRIYHTAKTITCKGLSKAIAGERRTRCSTCRKHTPCGFSAKSKTSLSPLQTATKTLSIKRSQIPRSACRTINQPCATL